ncbi:MAG: ATP-binding protein, partial [Candidatus Polarisedimenticolia bacterium]
MTETRELPGAGPARALRRRRGGRLKIGDEWMAIQIIARSQTNPQKAVAELVENSIDAGATRIRIVRGRRRGRVFLGISDDGRGVPLTPEGIPDFDYVATHVCDSLKRRLDERQRSGVQGEFGIGLLGFWSIGRELEMISQADRGPAYVMTMRAGSRAYDRRRYLGARPGSGVDVTIHDVHREAQIRLTAEKLQRYLSEELRDRVRRSGVTIVLEDRLPPRKTVEVRPAVFKGEPIADLSSIPVDGHPPIRAELYVARPGGGSEPGADPPEGRADSPGRSGESPERSGSSERAAVALYRLGTRVCRDLSALPEFAREPWIGGGLEGVLDFPDFRLSPASREGFVPDAAYHAFVEALRGVEPRLVDRLRLEEEVRSEHASRSLVKELQSAFVRLLRDLPTGEYDWFGSEGARPFAGGGNGRPAGPAALPGSGG